MHTPLLQQLLFTVRHPKGTFKAWSKELVQPPMSSIALQHGHKLSWASGDPWDCDAQCEPGSEDVPPGLFIKTFIECCAAHHVHGGLQSWHAHVGPGPPSGPGSTADMDMAR